MPSVQQTAAPQGVEGWDAVSRKHLNRAPHRPKNGAVDWWWYEQNGGICIVVESSHRTEQFNIRWNAIRAALKRKDRKP